MRKEKRLSPTKILKREIKELRSRIDHFIGEADSRNRNHSSEIERMRGVITDKSATINQRDVTIASQSSTLQQLAAERDRIYRMVELFTSVQISPMPGGGPRDLRKT